MEAECVFCLDNVSLWPKLLLVLHHQTIYPDYAAELHMLSMNAKNPSDTEQTSKLKPKY